MVLALGTFLAGCLVVPYRPSAETKTGVAAITNPERLLLTIEPRKFLKDMAKAVSKADKRLQFADGRAVIDMAAPADRNVAWLMSPSTRELIAPLQLDYLVLLAEPTERTLEEDDDLLLATPVPIPVAAGFYKEKHSTAYWSAVLDARTLQLVGQLTSEAVGTDRQFALMYALILVSDTKGAARKAVVQHIVDSIAAVRPTGPLRVALLAVERIPTKQADPWRAKRRDLASPPWVLDRYATFVPAAPPADGQALIYLYRPAPSGFEYETMDLATGAAEPDALVTRLHSGGYYPFYAPAGDITLRVSPWVSGQPPAHLTLRLEAGATYFLRGGADSSLPGGTSPTLNMVNVGKTPAELANCRLMPSAREYDAEVERRAERGDWLAQVQLQTLKSTGATYADGTSVPPDYMAAYRWSLISENKAGREALAARLTPGQIAEAGEQARQWQENFRKGKR